MTDTEHSTSSSNEEDYDNYATAIVHSIIHISCKLKVKLS